MTYDWVIFSRLFAAQTSRVAQIIICCCLDRVMKECSIERKKTIKDKVTHTHTHKRETTVLAVAELLVCLVNWCCLRERKMCGETKSSMRVMPCLYLCRDSPCYKEGVPM